MRNREDFCNQKCLDLAQSMESHEQQKEQYHSQILFYPLFMSCISKFCYDVVSKCLQIQGPDDISFHFKSKILIHGILEVIEYCKKEKVTEYSLGAK